eukprot:CAMPEP_0181209372 /NCGR_PEP_ID=MMETSP1096-20121128/22634_1 /TAXON_ID=156174 ORGANISM="Chrysochromulina ericina, Strain CCMP281" /NCGR_SAMPLE_ID=MMETSP1096 /ASSEMBLY_ACC=CAM_ASM_000453 /LENGTH=77 /DNA_ID=CAMNT_0023300535 /DNA_START=197 /DNA_END=430 /DNA_ORIENTATION=+
MSRKGQPPVAEFAVGGRDPRRKSKAQDGTHRARKKRIYALAQERASWPGSAAHCIWRVVAASLSTTKSTTHRGIPSH